MKEKIFYSIWERDSLDDTPYCTVALHQNPKINNKFISDTFCLAIGNYKGVPSFKTVEEARHYIYETLKPFYFNSFQENYELVRLDFSSDEWIGLMAMWIKCKEDLLNMLNSMGNPGGEQ